MNARDQGLLIAAREARRRAEEERALGNKWDRDRHMDKRARQHYRHADMFDDFAKWCEFEANAYEGASLLIVG